MNRELKRLAEHQTRVDNPFALGKGVFGLPIPTQRRRLRVSLPHQDTFYSYRAPRLGKKHQAIIPDLSYDSTERDDQIILNPLETYSKGKRVDIFWPDEKKWYTGTINQKAADGLTYILFDDGTQDWFDVDSEYKMGYLRYR